MLFSVFSVCASAKNVDINDAVKVEASGFVNDKITYTIYLKPNVKLRSAVFQIKFDPEVLKPVMKKSGDDGYVFDNDGAYVKKDKYGDTTYSVPGVYVSGMVYGSKKACSVGYTNIEEYKNGSSNKPFIKVTFKAISSDRPRTTVTFSCVEFRSSDKELDFNSKDRTPLKFYTHETSTLSQIKLTDVTSVKNGLKIQWEPTTGACGYRVFGEKNGEMVKLVDVGATVTSYIDKNAKANVKSTYTVRALDAGGKLDSKRGADVSGVYVKAPKTITLSVKPAGVMVKWTKVAGATSYKLYRREISSNGTKSSWLFLTTAKKTATSYLDKEELDSGVNYEYTIVTYAGSDKSAMYSFANTWFYKAPAAKLASVADGLRVTWNKVGGAQSYKVYRKYNGEAKWTCIATVKANTLKFIDNTAVSGKNITYAVKAYGKNGNSWYIAQTIDYIATPELKSVKNTSSGVQIKWSSVKGAKSYVVMRKTGNATKWVQIATVSKTTYTDKTAKKGTTYKYTVKALNGKKVSGYNSAGLTIKRAK